MNSTPAEAAASPISTSSASVNQGLTRSCCCACEPSSLNMTACVGIGLVARYPARRYSNDRPPTTNNLGLVSLSRQIDAATKTEAAGKQNAKHRTAVATNSTIAPSSMAPTSLTFQFNPPDSCRSSSAAIGRPETSVARPKAVRLIVTLPTHSSRTPRRIRCPKLDVQADRRRAAVSDPSAPIETAHCRWKLPPRARSTAHPAAHLPDPAQPPCRLPATHCKWRSKNLTMSALSSGISRWAGRPPAETPSVSGRCARPRHAGLALAGAYTAVVTGAVAAGSVMLADPVST